MSKLHLLVYIWGLSSAVACFLDNFEMSFYFWVYALVTYIIWIWFLMDEAERELEKDLDLPITRT